MTARHLANLAAPLLGDALPTLPLLIVYLTDGCNSRCAMCDIWRAPRRNMALTLAEQLAEDAHALHTRWVVLSGGEAMQHPQWPAIARLFRARGMRVILLTNALFLRRQADAVLASVDEVVVSLDGGTPATYEAIRGVDALGRVLEGIRAVRAGGVPVITRTTLQAANLGEMRAILSAARSADATRISFLTIDVSNPFAFGDRALASAAGSIAPADIPVQHAPAVPPGVPSLAQIEQYEAELTQLERDCAADFAARRIAETPAKLRSYAAYFRALHGQGAFPPVRCNAPDTSIVVEVDGRVRSCYFLPQVGAVVKGLEREEQMEYPQFAVREAIVNAICHRDYRLRGRRIEIRMYSDRLEILSPGGLPGFITVENIVDEHFSRNPRLVNGLFQWGYIEELGLGIDRMFEVMEQAGHLPPSFDARPYSFAVTLYNSRERQTVPDWVRNTNFRQSRALQYIKDHGSITNREYRSLCQGVSAETLRLDLADMVERGILLKVGSKKGTYYILK
jgi:MoaA/NifB/PqqE/SkfB family radical SAM enzyme